MKALFFGVVTLFLIVGMNNDAQAACNAACQAKCRATHHRPRSQRRSGSFASPAGGQCAELWISELLNFLGQYRELLAAYASAKPFFERALRIREQVLGPEHRDGDDPE
jgi:hypothetical protein